MEWIFFSLQDAAPPFYPRDRCEAVNDVTRVQTHTQKGLRNRQINQGRGTSRLLCITRAGDNTTFMAARPTIRPSGPDLSSRDTLKMTPPT